MLFDIQARKIGLRSNMPYSVSDLCRALNISEKTISNFRAHDEASDYSGCDFTYSQKKYVFRQAKVTPKKIGLFVTLWKRNLAGLTEPFDDSDELDAMLVLCLDSPKKGLFCFPREELLARKILSDRENRIEGKRGFRVYPAWSAPQNKQASQTKNWQAAHFSHEISLK